jgi:hypothetical protein
MPRTKTITLYKYDELPTEKAKEKARDWYRQISAGDSSTLETTVETFKEIAEKLGFGFNQHSVPLVSGKTRQEANIWWNLGYSQGDGASFDGKWYMTGVDLLKLRADFALPEGTASQWLRKIHSFADQMDVLVENLKTNKIKDARAVIDSDSRYYSMQINDVELLDESGGEASAELHDEFEKNLKEFVRDLGNFLYWSLREDDTANNADENVADNIIANEHEFLEDGSKA